MTPSDSLVIEVKRRARELGFDLVGITTAEPPPHAAHFRQWLADGCHGEMNYLARNADRRCDPRRVLPGARSVIVVGLNYWALTEQRPPEGGAPSPPPRVARYAAAPRDYHDVMGEKLKELAKLVDGLWYVDTGPVLERDLAQRAGLGFIGKHTNLVSRQFGNWVLLGVVLTALELPADEPERTQCGTCTRCLKACPTGALTAPYRLDARRCISYLTIELKGSIPAELQPLIGERVFGCDACLEACPWNRFARPVVRPRPLPALAEFLDWDEARFNAFFRGTPIFRLKFGRFLRNVRIALANHE
jgi:epoxyqueuosine reductase